MIISIDTREQEPLNITAAVDITEVRHEKLPFGDYGCRLANDEPLCPVFFERKAKGDLWGTLTSGIDRFKRELERVRESKATLYLAIEGSMTDIYAGYSHSQVFGSQIIRTIFTLKVKYGLEPVFCPDRAQMKYYVLETFDALKRNWERQ